MIDMRIKTEAIPGRAVTKPSTTRRRRGATEMTRSTRRMRKARSAEKPWLAGASETPTITRSNTLQPSRKKRRPRA